MGKVLIGRLYHSFGVKGEAKVTPNTSFPEERFQPGKKVFLSKSGKEFVESSFEDVRGTLKEPIVKLAGIDTPEEAEKLKGYGIYLEEEDAPLPEGYYRLEELKGLAVKNDEGKILGTVDDVFTYSKVPAVKVVREEGKPFYFPFLMGDFISKIDLDKKEIVIHEVAGML